MTLREFYRENGGDYDEVLSRVLKEERMVRYLGLFQKEDAYQKLCESVKNKDYQAGFEHSHNLKGVCLNLGLGDLQRASSTICEELRHGQPGEDLEKMLGDVTTAYNKVIDGIAQIQQG